MNGKTIEDNGQVSAHKSFGEIYVTPDLKPGMEIGKLELADLKRLLDKMLK